MDKVIVVGRVDYPNHSRPHQQDYVQSAGGVCRCIPAGTHASTPHLLKTLTWKIIDKKMKIKVITLFSGYDSQCLALDRLKEQHPDFDYDLLAWSEIDKYAIQAHNLIYPQWADRNLGDVSKIEWEKYPEFKDCDLLTYSFPCTDISAAGKQQGFEQGSGTRSGLLWECEKAIAALKPKYLLMENVKALVSKKFMPHFQEWCALVAEYGYQNYYKVLNATEFGVPQNRERVFMTSVRNDIDLVYAFPQPYPLTLTLDDVLEEEVEDKYYLKNERIEGLLTSTIEGMKKKDGYTFKAKKR